MEDSEKDSTKPKITISVSPKLEGANVDVTNGAPELGSPKVESELGKLLREGQRFKAWKATYKNVSEDFWNEKMVEVKAKLAMIVFSLFMSVIVALTPARPAGFAVFVVLCGLFLFFVARRLHLERSDFTLAKITANAAALVVFTFFFLISLCTGLIALVGLSEGDWLAGFLIGLAACGCRWVGVTLSRAVGRRIERLRSLSILLRP